MKDWVKFNLRYRGKSDEDFETFLSQFEICCKLHEVPSNQYVMLMGLYVKELAATYLREIIKSSPGADYNTVKQALKLRVRAGKGSEHTAMTVSAMRQGVEESVSLYYERFRKTIAQSDLEETSPFILLHFRTGLKPRIQEAVLPLAGRSLSELFQAATAVETGLAGTANTVSAF